MSQEGSSRRLVASLAALGVALFAIPLAVEKVEDQPATIDVRVLDSFTASILHQSYPNADLMNGLVLAVGCGLAAMAALFLWSVLGGNRQLQRFFLVTAIGLGALAVEETFELSELVAYKISIDPKRTDLFVPIVGAVYLVVYRRLLLSSRRALWLGGAGAAIFLAAAFVDALPGVHRVEDPMETVASLLLLTGFVALVLDLLARTMSRARASGAIA